MRRLGVAAVVVLCLVVLVGSAAADDAQKLNISDATVNEADAGGKAVFRISLTDGADADATVQWATSNGSAVAGQDYTTASGTATVSKAGFVEIDVPITNDGLDENNETFTVTLTNPTRATIEDGTATGTILNDDAPPSTTGISDATVEEGGTANFTVGLSGPSGKPITINYSTVPGSATAPGDYTAEINQNITINPGATSGTISIATTEDAVPEPTESFTVNLNSGTNVTIAGDTQGAGTITDDDTPPAITSVGDATVTEGHSGQRDANFTVTLSKPAPTPVTIRYSTTASSATSPSDYEAASNATLTIPVGQSSGTITIKVNGDTLPEGSGDPRSEVFFVDILSATGATLGSDTRGTGTIVDDDTPPTVTSISDPTVTEGNSGTVDANFVVTLSGAAPTPVAIRYSTLNGSAVSPDDYTGVANGTLNIPAGSSQGTITIKVIGDTIPEGTGTPRTENFFVDLLSATGAALGGDTRGVGTITDDDAARTLSIVGAEVTEGDGGTVNLDFSVRLSGPTAQQVQVTATTADGSAVAPSDYQARTQVLTWAPNSSGADLEKTFRVFVNGDTLDEVDETLTVTLSSPQNAAIATGAATGTIKDNDNRSLLAIGNAEANEGAAGAKSTMTFKVTLSPTSARPVSLSYATANGSATAGSDYEAKEGQISFAPGETEKTIEVVILGDDVNEENETVLVNLSNIAGAALAGGGGQGSGTIVDKNAPPSISIDDVQARESEGASFTVTLAGTTLRTVTVTFGTSDGTAREGSDYNGRRGTLTFAPGEKTKKIDVTVLDDTDAEVAETFSVGLGNPVNATVTKATGVATIEASDGGGLGSTQGGGTGGLNNDRPPLTVNPKPTGPKGGVLPSMALSSSTLYRNGRLRMQATCNPQSLTTCRGTITLVTTTKPVLTLGTKSFTIRKGKKVYIWFVLSTKGRKLLAEKRVLQVRLIVVVRSSTNKTRRVVPGVITVRLPKTKVANAAP